MEHHHPCVFFIHCSLQGTMFVPFKEHHIFVCLFLLFLTRNNTLCVRFSFINKHFVNIISLFMTLYQAQGYKYIWKDTNMRITETSKYWILSSLNKIALYWSKKKGHNHLYHFTALIPIINQSDWLFVPCWFFPKPYNSLCSLSSKKVKGILSSIWYV